MLAQLPRSVGRAAAALTAMALAALLPIAPASADHSRHPDFQWLPTAVLTSPWQATTCHLADGRSLPCTVRSHLVVLAGGAARGQARVQYEGPDGESLVVKITYLAARLVRSEDGNTVVFQGEGEVCTFRGGCQPLEDLRGTVGPSPGAGGILIYDIKDGHELPGVTFETEEPIELIEITSPNRPPQS